MKRLPFAALAVAILIAAPAWAADPTVAEVLGILKQRGLVDQARYEELVAKNAAYEKKQDSLLGPIEWSGDIRARLENFWFSRDDLGNKLPNRARGRWRLRLAGKVPINDWVTGGFRIATGTFPGDLRSTNESFGNSADFAPGGLFLDRAYIDLKLPAGESNTHLVLGKQSNPFRWKNGPDNQIWDGDINPEGVSLRTRFQPSENVDLFGNAGYFIIKENGTHADPHLFALQGGASLQASDTVEIGGRASWYSFHALDGNFLARQMAWGNTTDLTGGAMRSLDALEFGGYVRIAGSEDWPVLAYANLTKNLDANNALAGRQDLGYGGGIEVGDKAKVVKVGVGYWVAQANFWPAIYTDSDLLDGFTNRKGWAIYGGKQILPGTELDVTLLIADALKNDVPPYGASVTNADRVRLQTDIVVKF